VSAARPTAAWAVASGATLSVALWAGRAGATGEVGRVVTDTSSGNYRIAAQTDASRFSLASASGFRFTSAVRADWSPRPGLALRLRVPYHFMALDDGARFDGWGDAELRIKTRIFGIGDYVLVQAGVIQTLPTGSKQDRLGNGAMVLTPFVTAGRRFGETIIYAYVSDAVTLRRDNALAYEDITDPSTDHEARSAIGAMLAIKQRVQANVSMSAITILGGRDVGQTFVHGGPIVGVLLTDAARLVLGGQVPVAGERRFDWRTTADVYFSF
jgi:hypothetical protein